MRVSIKCVVLLALSIALSWSVPGISAEEESATKVQRMSEAIVQDLVELKLLLDQIEKSDSIDVKALQFRKDGRSFDLLAALDALAVEVSKLPEASEERVAAQAMLTRDLELVGEVIFNRLSELRDGLVSALKERDSLSGGAKIAKDVYIQSLQAMQFQYYESLVNHLESRKLLGISSGAQRKRLVEILYTHAEKLSGQVEYASVSLLGLQKQLDADPENAEISVVLADMGYQQKLSVSNLEQLVRLRERLGESSTQYKAVLLKGSSEISVELLSVRVVRTVLRDWGLAMGETAKANAPGYHF